MFVRCSSTLFKRSGFNFSQFNQWITFRHQNESVLSEYLNFMHELAPYKTFSSFQESANHVRYCRCLFSLLFNNCRSFFWKHSSRPNTNAKRSILVKALSIWLQVETTRTQGGNVNFNKLSIPQSFGCKATALNTETPCCSYVWFIDTEKHSNQS